MCTNTFEYHDKLLREKIGMSYNARNEAGAELFEETSCGEKSYGTVPLNEKTKKCVLGTLFWHTFIHRKQQ